MKKVVLRENGQTYETGEYAVALGFFDGLHQGHQSLVNEVLKVSREKRLTSAVMTFDAHPLEVLGVRHHRCLTTLDDKATLLEDMGVEVMFIIEFTTNVARLAPDVFVQKYLVELGARHVVTGTDFHFGHQNSGSVEDLKHCDFDLSIMDPVMYNDTRKVSSTLIKELLLNGDVEEAARLLTRPYQPKGTIVHGKHRGHDLGFPTANIHLGRYAPLKDGVYGVLCDVGNVRALGMANVGTNPTFDDIKETVMETHLFDVDENLYGDEMRLKVMFFERPETRFDSVEALVDQLTRDKKNIRHKMEELV